MGRGRDRSCRRPNRYERTLFADALEQILTEELHMDLPANCRLEQKRKRVDFKSG